MKATSPKEFPEDHLLKPLPKMKTDHLKLPLICLLKKISISFNEVSVSPNDLILICQPIMPDSVKGFRNV